MEKSVALKIMIWAGREEIKQRIDLLRLKETIGQTFVVDYDPESPFKRLNLKIDGMVFEVWASGKILVRGTSETQFQQANKLCRQLKKTIKTINYVNE